MSDLVSHDSPPSRLERLADLAPALGLLLFHLALLPGYGVFRDELYYMACGRRPGWGYVDHPPLVGLGGLGRPPDHRGLAPGPPSRGSCRLAAATTVFVAARIAKELGGGPFARLLHRSRLHRPPSHLSRPRQHLFDERARSALLGASSFWILVPGSFRPGATRGCGWPSAWWPDVGLLNKISVLFLGFGLVVGPGARGAAVGRLPLPLVLGSEASSPRSALRPPPPLAAGERLADAGVHGQRPTTQDGAVLSVPGLPPRDRCSRTVPSRPWLWILGLGLAALRPRRRPRSSPWASCVSHRPGWSSS